MDVHLWIPGLFGYEADWVGELVGHQDEVLTFPAEKLDYDERRTVIEARKIVSDYIGDHRSRLILRDLVRIIERLTNG